MTKRASLLLLVAAVLCGIPARAGQDEERLVSGGRLKRGSMEEAEQFRQHQLRSEKRPRPPRQSAVGSGAVAATGGRKGVASAGAGPLPAPKPAVEIRKTLAPGERPALRALKEAQGFPALPSAGSGAPQARPAPLADDFTVEYELGEDAEVSVTIVGPDGAIVHQLALPPGIEGSQRGRNRLAYWDGRDPNGNPAPPGEYQALQSIRYAGSAEPESRVLPLKKVAR